MRTERLHPAAGLPEARRATHRRPDAGVPRPLARDAGPATITLLVVGLAALWTFAHPPGEDGLSYLGQLLGAEAVLLLAIGLVLISTLPWVEAWFDGIDRAAIWHRRVAITGLVLLAPHVMLASGEGTGLGGPLATIGIVGLVALAVWAIIPRWRSIAPAPLRDAILALREVPGVREARAILGGYERWRLLHRTTGLFLAAGFLHGLLDGTPWDEAPLLRWTYVAIGGVGLAFYVYRELLARFFLSLHDYEVAAVRPVGRDLTELALRPLGRPVAFVPGQFAMVYVEARDGWHRHPFTIASAPAEGVLRVTVKALGDYTSRVQELVEPGMPAVVGGPHGRFDHRRGTRRQVWIAGGVGIAPFLSWVRSIAPDAPVDRVDLFAASDGELPFAAELRAAADRLAYLHVHLVDTSVAGRLTPEQVLAAAGADPRELSVFLCGPEGMLRTFQVALRRAGVRGRNVHREHFDWR